ncbi:hypothetical protein [Sphingomonas montana]|uniref:hypothetical protein n=1 Tax=Sphingomonas montana TaxID=1843236 RepID=UPI0013EB1DD4|nr:hypothetical protein [Sphingomonas montana]
MAKPPPSPPSSDIDGVFMDARPGVPNRDVSKGTAKELDDKQDLNVARPKEDSV